jgi:hypothetical protein
MKTFLKTIRIGWEYLTHPYIITDKLIEQKDASKYSWTFLTLSLILWTIVTGYQNLVVGESSRAREVKFDISFGPDIIVTLLTIPIGIATVIAISFIISKLVNWFGGNASYKDTFKILAFTLNIGPTFFDLQFEMGATLTGHAWQLHEVPNFIYYAIFIMFGPIVWSLIITFLALSHYSKLSLIKTMFAFVLGVLPLFLLLLFIVM